MFLISAEVFVSEYSVMGMGLGCSGVGLGGAAWCGVVWGGEEVILTCGAAGNPATDVQFLSNRQVAESKYSEW